MRTFEMSRGNDESGVSGTGLVLEGSIYSNGVVIVYWAGGKHKSFGWYDNYFEFYSIHVASHPTNKTVMKFDHEELCKTLKREKDKLCRHCKQPYVDHPKDVQHEESNFRRTCSGNLVELI